MRRVGYGYSGYIVSSGLCLRVLSISGHWFRECPQYVPKEKRQRTDAAPAAPVGMPILSIVPVLVQSAYDAPTLQGRAGSAWHRLTSIQSLSSALAT